VNMMVFENDIDPFSVLSVGQANGGDRKVNVEGMKYGMKDVIPHAAKLCGLSMVKSSQ